MTTTRVVLTPEGFVEPEALDAHSMPSTPQPVPYSLQTRVHDGAFRMSVGSSGPEQGGVTRHSVSHAGSQGGSVLATIRQDGPTQSVELIPGNPASRTDVRVAIREGLLRVNAAGQLEDAANLQEAVQRVQAAPAPQQYEDPGRDVFDPRLDQMWAEEIAPLPQAAYDATLARMTGFLAHDVGDVDDMARSLARDVQGMEPAAAKETILNGLYYFQQALGKALEPAGITGERVAQFLADCRRNQPGKLQQAVQMLTHMRDPSGFTMLAREWEAMNPGPMVEAARAAGFEVARDPEGGWLARPKGSDGGWQSLAKLFAHASAAGSK